MKKKNILGLLLLATSCITPANAAAFLKHKFLDRFGKHIYKSQPSRPIVVAPEGLQKNLPRKQLTEEVKAIALEDLAQKSLDGTFYDDVMWEILYSTKAPGQLTKRALNIAIDQKHTVAIKKLLKINGTLTKIDENVTDF